MSTQSNNENVKDNASDLTAGKIVAMLESQYDTVKSTEGKALAFPKAGGHAVEIQSLGPAISAHIYRTMGHAISKSTITTAIDTLIGLTETKPAIKVSLRSFQSNDDHGPIAIHVDLGDHTSESVIISEWGWELQSEMGQSDELYGDDGESSKPVFRRTATVQALPVPSRGGEGRKKLASVLNLDPSDAKFHLLWGWLVASVFVEMARPVLWITGQQGSGKTTTGLFVLSVINPAERMGGNFGKNEKDDITLLAGSFLPSFDNVTSVSAEVNNFICRMVTGSMETGRTLYTNGELFISVIKRTAVFSSINLPIGLREDGLERLVHIEFDRISSKDRLREGDIDAQFRRDHAEILGSLFDDVASVLREFRTASVVLEGHLPRMADFATVLCALDIAAEPTIGKNGPHLNAYQEVLQTSMEDRAMEDPFTLAIIRQAQKSFTGTYSELSEILDKAPERPSDHKMFWPVGPRPLGDALRRHGESLRSVGVDIQQISRVSKGNRISLTMSDEGKLLHQVPDPTPVRPLTTSVKVMENTEKVI